MNLLNIIQSNHLDFGIKFLTFLLVFLIMKFIIAKRLSKLSEVTENRLDDIFSTFVVDISLKSLVLVSLYINIEYLKPTQIIENSIFGLMLLFISVDISGLLRSLVEYYFTRKITKNKRTETLKIAVKNIFSGFNFIVFGLVFLSGIGVNISSLVAGLGITGIAIALAVKNILEDIFSALTIYIDQPFSIGDFVIVNGVKGTIKKIGLKSTILTSYDGAETILSNKKITSQTIENFGRLKKRFHSFIIGVDYKTEDKLLKKIPKILESCVLEDEKLEFHSCHIDEFASSSINFKLSFYYKGPEYKLFVKSLNNVYLAIIKAFKKEKISIPFDTITINK